jgi:hypothetical protein
MSPQPMSRDGSARALRELQAEQKLASLHKAVEEAEAALGVCITSEAQAKGVSDGAKTAVQEAEAKLVAAEEAISKSSSAMGGARAERTCAEAKVAAAEREVRFLTGVPAPRAS